MTRVLGLVFAVIVTFIIIYATYPKVIEHRWNHFTRNAKDRFVAAHIARHIPSGSLVLDIGSGDGHISRAIGDYVPSSTVIPLDIEDLHISGPSPILFDGQNIPRNDNTANATTVLYVLHHAKNPTALLRDISRVITPNGVIVVAEDTLDTPIDHVLTRFHSLSSYGSGGFRSTKEWVSLFEKLGFGVRHVVPLSRWSLPIYPVSRTLFVLTTV